MQDLAVEIEVALSCFPHSTDKANFLLKNAQSTVVPRVATAAMRFVMT